MYMKYIYIQIDLNKTIKYNISSSTIGIGLGKPHSDTVTSPLFPKIHRG